MKVARETWIEDKCEIDEGVTRATTIRPFTYARLSQTTVSRKKSSKTVLTWQDKAVVNRWTFAGLDNFLQGTELSILHDDHVTNDVPQSYKSWEEIERAIRRVKGEGSPGVWG